MEPLRKCFDCKEDKPLKNFSKDSNRPLGREYICKVCKKQRDAKHYQKNRQRIIAQVMEYQRRMKNDS